MQKSLYWKLTIAFILVAFTSSALVALFMRVTSVDRLTQLVTDQQRNNLEQALAEYYQANGSWDGVEIPWRQLQFLNAQTPVPAEKKENSPPKQWPDFPDRRFFFGLADAQGVVIVPIDRETPPGSKLPAEVLKRGTPILVDGNQVGTILTDRREPGFNPAEAMFLQRTNQALIFAMLGALLVALLIGLLLARTLTHPLQALTQAAQRIAQGQLEQQVQVDSEDELGQLALAFNRMSQEVARGNQLRRQMTADIAHDLRTPLTVIAGYVESMRDGVLQPTPQRLSLIYTEIERIQNLVGDLRMLSQVDAGELRLHPQHISPKVLLDQAAELFQHHAELQSVDLSVEVSENLPDIVVDEARMMQVLDNLISNALRYTSNGGRIILSAMQNNAKVNITVQDTGIGIADEELPYIFDRFHRADKSRHSETGESGLGLAIVKALVEAQGGVVGAESAPGKGTRIHIEFPSS